MPAASGKRARSREVVVAVGGSPGIAVPAHFPPMRHAAVQDRNCSILNVSALLFVPPPISLVRLGLLPISWASSPANPDDSDQFSITFTHTRAFHAQSLRHHPLARPRRLHREQAEVS